MHHFSARSIRRAFAPASGKAPPRPYPLRELFALANDCVRTVLPLTCHPERREPCAANVVELLRVERSRRQSSKQKREALAPMRDLRRITNSFPKGKLHPSTLGAPSLQKRNIPLAGQIRLVTRSLRRCAPCPHCIRSAHFNRVRLRASPFAQDDA